MYDLHSAQFSLYKHLSLVTYHCRSSLSYSSLFISAKARRVAAVLHVVDSQLKDFVFSLIGLFSISSFSHTCTVVGIITPSLAQPLYSTFLTAFDSHTGTRRLICAYTNVKCFFQGRSKYFTVNLKNLFWAERILRGSKFNVTVAIYMLTVEAFLSRINMKQSMYSLRSNHRFKSTLSDIV